jgi:hypothetical protein
MLALPERAVGEYVPLGPLRQVLLGAQFGNRKEVAMSKLQLEPQERMELLVYLEALLGCVKSLHASVGAIMADIAAIRNTVFEDPEEIATYTTSLRLAMATAKPIVDEAMHSYDDLLQEIADSQQYTN